MFIYLRIVCGCFPAMMAKLGHCKRDLCAEKSKVFTRDTPQSRTTEWQIRQISRACWSPQCVYTFSGYTWILRNTFKSKSSCPALIQRRSLGFGLGVYSPKGQKVRQFHISRVNVTDSDCTRFPDGGHCASAGFRPRDQVCGLGNATCLGHCGMRV